MKFTPQYHVTATERKAIAFLLASGHTYARNRPNTKTYDIISGGSDGKTREYVVKIGSYYRHGIGENPKWSYQNCAVTMPAQA